MGSRSRNCRGGGSSENEDESDKGCGTGTQWSLGGREGGHACRSGVYGRDTCQTRGNGGVTRNRGLGSHLVSHLRGLLPSWYWPGSCEWTSLGGTDPRSTEGSGRDVRCFYFFLYFPKDSSHCSGTAGWFFWLCVRRVVWCLLGLDPVGLRTLRATRGFPRSREV